MRGSCDVCPLFRAAEVASRCISPCSKPLKRPTFQLHLGLKPRSFLTACSVVESQLRLERRRVQCTALGRRPKNRATNKWHRPKNRRSQKRKGEAVFCRSRACAPVVEMSGRPCLVRVPLLCLLVALVGRSRCPVAPGFSPGLPCFFFSCDVCSGSALQGRRPQNR